MAFAYSNYRFLATTAIIVALLRNLSFLQHGTLGPSLEDVHPVRYHRLAPKDGITIHGNHYLGKAFIISTDKSCPPDIIFTAKQSGFYPYLVDAIQPNANRFSNYAAFLDFCFDGENVTGPANMSGGEVALVGSHRMALQRIANDPDLSDHDWSIILESDARLHPDAASGARALVESAISRENQNSSGYGFMYLGACAPTCENVIGSIGQNCIGQCTHALAFTKQRAMTFFRELYCMKGSQDAPCGWICKEKSCIIDQMMRQFFSQQTHPSNLLVGYDFVSPDNKGHRGLMYQCCRTEAAKAKGTSLKSITFSPMLSEDSHRFKCFRAEFTGRVGNLMFEYAALVGVCVKHGLQPETCAGFSMSDLSKHNVMLPTKMLHELFEIPMVSCPTNASMTYREHANSIYAIKFDANLLERPTGTSFQGYLQSYKYFHHARSEIQRLYSFSDDVILRTKEFFFDIRRQSKSASHREIACISIRRGDKTRNNNKNFYDDWSLSMDYYWKALGLLRQRNHNLIFVYLVGGGTDPQMTAEDRQWVKDTFITPHSKEPSFLEPEDFTEANAMHMMTECDNLVVSASSFSWWGGYLGNKDRLIIAPKEIQIDFVSEDYYPPSWTLISKD